MKKDEIFFGEVGLTSTSANFIANLAKECYQPLEVKLSKIRFYDEYVALLSGGTERKTKAGLTDVSNFLSDLDRIAKLKSLIAWLREALKARDNLIAEVKDKSASDYGIELPQMPASSAYLTPEDVIGTWGIKQRNRYLYLDTLCATIGQFIHPKGQYATQKELLHEVINEPYNVQGSGNDTIIYTRSASISPQVVDENFMELQQKYRSYQAELNSMKHEIESTIEQDKATKDAEQEKALLEYRLKAQECAAKVLTLRNQELARIQKLKIIIPDSLKGIYEEVQKLGKK